MGGTEYRLGDLIDDYCPRCRLLLNHAVASLVDRKVVKVICQTCYTEHPYRRGRSGKIDGRLELRKHAAHAAVIVGRELLGACSHQSHLQ